MHALGTINLQPEGERESDCVQEIRLGDSRTEPREKLRKGVVREGELGVFSVCFGLC